MLMLVTSPKWTILATEWQTIAKGLGITLLGAGLTYIATAVSPTNFGSFWWSPLAVVLFSTLVNIGQRYVREHQVLMEVPQPQRLILDPSQTTPKDYATGTPTNP